MGMAGTFLRISQEKLEQLRSDPNSIESLVEQFFTSRFSIERSGDSELCDVDKSWQTIHFMLSGGNPWGGNTIEAQAIMGGAEIGPDLGYGPARYLTSDQVKQVSQALAPITQEEFSNRFDPQAMAAADLYAFDLEYAEDELEMAQDYFGELKKFYARSAQQNDAVLLLIT